MTLPTRGNPFRQLTRLDPYSDFEELLRGLGTHSIMRDYDRSLDMRLDVNEDDKAYVINIDIPGVKKDDIDVIVEGNQITVSAEIKREQSQGKGKEIYSERYVGKTYRSFSLPTEVDSTHSEARYDGGVLTLTLPKRAGNGSKRLSIN